MTSPVKLRHVVLQTTDVVHLSRLVGDRARC